MTRQRVPNQHLYRDTARQNLLTNGGFEIWQRGNGPFTANGAWTADRWSIGLAGTDTLSVSKNTGSIDSTTAAGYAFATSNGAGQRITVEANP